MIVSIEKLQTLEAFSDMDVAELTRMQSAVEDVIRAYTNNNFQNRNVRFEGASSEYEIFGVSPFLAVGDTVQITKSSVNDGLAVITEITDDSILVDKWLYSIPLNRVTKVEYPDAIVQGAINLLLWEVDNREKVGIKSETISRHSTTYYDQDANNTVMGYPISLMGFCKPYMKAR